MYAPVADAGVAVLRELTTRFARALRGDDWLARSGVSEFAVLVSGTVADAENSMAELALLAETAGSQVLDALYQRRDSPDPALGAGVLEEPDLRVAAVGRGEAPVPPGTPQADDHERAADHEGQ